MRRGCLDELTRKFHAWDSQRVPAISWRCWPWRHQPSKNRRRVTARLFSLFASAIHSSRWGWRMDSKRPRCKRQVQRTQIVKDTPESLFQKQSNCDLTGQSWQDWDPAGTSPKKSPVQPPTKDPDKVSLCSLCKYSSSMFFYSRAFLNVSAKDLRLSAQILAERPPKAFEGVLCRHPTVMAAWKRLWAHCRPVSSAKRHCAMNMYHLVLWIVINCASLHIIALLAQNPEITTTLSSQRSPEHAKSFKIFGDLSIHYAANPSAKSFPLSFPPEMYAFCGHRRVEGRLSDFEKSQSLYVTLLRVVAMCLTINSCHQCHQCLSRENNEQPWKTHKKLKEAMKAKGKEKKERSITV